MPVIGAAYLRCSDPKQDKSIDQQRAEIERRAAADGVVIPPENWFIDEGISGRSTKKRASYQGLIKRAEVQRDAMTGRGKSRLSAPPIERLYVWAFSRIARNMFDCLRAIATLDDADIEIVSLTEHDTGDRSMRKLIRPILAWLAERYSEELSRNVQRGMASQASKGFWAYGTTSYGYEAVEVQGGKKLMVTDATRDDFEVVKRIFRMADEGVDGQRRIAQRLTREGIRPPSEENHPREIAPGTWLSRHVAKILTNPVYCGHVVNKGEVVARHAHEAAVDDVTFARIQAKRKLRAKEREEGGGNGASNLPVGRHGLLTPFLRCGSCGGRMVLVAGSRAESRTWLYFCGTRRDNKLACPGVSVRVDKLDPIVMETIEREVLAPDNVRELLDDTLGALRASDVDHAAAERERLATIITDLDRKIRLTMTHAVNGTIDEEDAKAISAPMVAQRETARLQLAALPARRAVPTVEQVNPEVFRAAVLEAWQQRPLEERREALSQVLDRITLEPGGVTVRYDAAGYCGHDRIGSVIHPSLPWMRLNRSPSCDRRAK
jgi:DNA invertase Pin-like site-specific DNA recombinase